METAVNSRPAMKETIEEQTPGRNILCAHLREDRIALVRVIGRGSFQNSVPLKRFAQKIAEEAPETRFVVDLRECETMDSTFMGVLAGICITQGHGSGGKLIILNANDHCRRLLKTLGLTHIVEMRDSLDDEALARAEAQLAPGASAGGSKLEQICLTLQAHKNLVRIDEQNEVRFQAVIEYLEKSLEAEGGTNGKC